MAIRTPNIGCTKTAGRRWCRSTGAASTSESTAAISFALYDYELPLTVLAGIGVTTGEALLAYLVARALEMRAVRLGSPVWRLMLQTLDL